MRKRRLLLALGLLAAAAQARSQQLGNLVSPGKLARAHAALEGIDNCQKCHEPGRQVTAEKCLSCHKPIADRIAARRGVHRAVRGECVSCHVEHAGLDADLRHLDRKTFDHGAQTRFPLEGRHAAADCAACHKTRSFLAASPSCISCHNDAHRGALGPDCAKCHSPAVPFKESRRAFDHGKTAFPLTGAHAALRCDQCHKNGEYKPLKFAACADCHRDPHRKSLGTCESCHTTSTFRTSKIEHAKTGFPLAGRHADVACEKCHTQSAVKVRVDGGKCSNCHRDVHQGLFKQDCASCHNETSFRGAPFDHAAKTRFPLTGRHSEIPCASCHKPGPPGPRGAARVVDFRGARIECASCHRDVHKGELGAACQTCHTTRSFKVTSYRHPRNPEFFAGSHASVACEKCHGRTENGAAPAAFKNVSFACADCHRDVHLGQVSKACETCHSVAAAKFAPSSFSHAATKFPLTGKHQALECAKCHRRETGAFPSGNGTAVRLRGLPLDCQGCHRDPHLGQLGPSCATCHSTATFAIARYVHQDKSRAGFFAGGHAKAECSACHKKSEEDYPSGRGVAVRYRKTPTDCASCHKDPHRGVLGQRCESCHSVGLWKNASRAFHKVGVFPLDGKHLLVPCESCHLKGVIQGTPTRCFDCHWIRRQDDLYRTRLGNQCETCHRTTSWTAVIWDHASRTGFPLSSPHRSLACDSCHKNQIFTAAPSDCYACHRSDYARTTAPSHTAAGFPTTCLACHGAADATWHQARFDHTPIYPLVGVHAAQPCAACHKNNVFAGTPRDCYGCHKPDYDRTVNPNHMAAGFATACQSCHSISDPSWSLAKFDHSFYPLIGVHASQPCSACHGNNVYAGTPRDCYGCHQPQYQQAANPNHLAAGFSTACQGCHKISDTTWQQGTFNHAAVFALVGVHATQPCAACHANNVFKGTPTDCYSCHKTLYQQTTNPNHAAAGFPTTCDTCHKATDANWNQASFNHASVFPLVGVHATQPCVACHVNNVFPGTPTDCYSCHKTLYQQTTNPNHAAAGFPTTCDTCHKATDPDWNQATFNHSQFFALVGVHATQPCAACHANNVFKGTPTDCYSCHKALYQQTTNPNHAAAGFPTTCDTCHKATDTNWNQGTFNHSQFFALVGVHATQPCAACHANNVFKGTPTDCYSCHKALYQQTTNPNHAAAGFPTTCQNCHKATDTNWNQGTFNHSTFYALVGVHATQPCGACHKNNVYAGTPTDCYSCHKTQYQQTTNPNHAAAGFPTTCQDCHKASDSSWTLGKFNHTWFPITSGPHSGNPCSACHTSANNFAVFTCVTCHGKSSTDSNHRGVSGYQYTSQACYSCHPNGRAGD